MFALSVFVKLANTAFEANMPTMVIIGTKIIKVTAVKARFSTNAFPFLNALSSPCAVLYSDCTTAIIVKIIKSTAPIIIKALNTRCTSELYKKRKIISKSCNSSCVTSVPSIQTFMPTNLPTKNCKKSTMFSINLTIK